MVGVSVRLDTVREAAAPGNRPAGGVEDDLVLIAGRAREAPLQEVDAVGGVGARQGEVVREAVAGHVAYARQRDQRQDPGNDDESAVVHGPPGDGEHWRSPRLWG